MSQSPSNRKQGDFTKLMMAGYQVDLNGGSTTDFYVQMKGPAGTPYEGARYQVHVELPENYPFTSPSIGFVNRIYHPNIDERSGSVCLDVINQTWTPLYSLVNVFDVFLPQLLTYPNPSDPLNSEAASVLLRDPKRFTEKVREFVAKYAQDCNDEAEADEKVSEMSELDLEADDLDLDESDQT